MGEMGDIFLSECEKRLGGCFDRKSCYIHGLGYTEVTVSLTCNGGQERVRLKGTEHDGTVSARYDELENVLGRLNDYNIHGMVIERVWW